ncbi:hypothetical protein Tfer_1452 [Thermincola ferriacetica]|uniref:Uncharacterized protein n=1 Tax=Thermincola ferriacetica TaxID=281456 RepID=A0A0L6W2P0_9FIRM|nr:hypothetical protein Tfer_1452 [Thermincola ferriacetica]
MHKSQPITEVIYLCNRAVHGQEVRIQDAKSIVDIGISLLSYLNGFIHDYTIKPSEVLEISQQELTNYKNAKYRVVSIIPYVERPVKNVRIVTQEGLDQLLEGYVKGLAIVGPQESFPFVQDVRLSSSARTTGIDVFLQPFLG